MRKTFLAAVLCAAVLTTGCQSEHEPSVDPQVVSAMPKSPKRGVAFNFSNIADLPLLSPYISWDYNWGNVTSDASALWFDANEMDFCPMCWNGNYSADGIRAFVAAHPNTKYLLAFNEPNLKDQANMVPSKAAELWAPVVALAKELNLKLVSPAMNYGTVAGYSDPIRWLDEFFAQPGVDINDIYAISIHCYMASASALQGYVEMFEKYGKPIWLTEFCAWDPVPGSVETQMNYMCTVLNYLETHSSVERYAWFIPRTSGKVDSAPFMQLLTHDIQPQLTDLGKMYCLFSPMDKNVWLRADRAIHAGEYVAVLNNAMPLRPSTDAVAVEQAGRDGLMITNLVAGQELTYQIGLMTDAKQIEVRYCGFSNGICEVMVDGVSEGFIDMPRNGSSTDWISAQLPVKIQKGKHSLTLRLVSGSCFFSAFSLNR